MALSSILSALSAAPTQGSALSALINGVVGLASPNPAIAQVTPLLSQLQVSLDSPASVGRLAGAIQANSGTLTTVGFLAGKLADVAAQTPYNQMEVNLLASEIASAINAAGQTSNPLAALNFMTPSIVSTIAAKPAA